ncbi:MAG TPA: alpha/beta fold hydrolase [Candidatus Angelobacter sp.]|jgi:hypothetical protein|nr:alpha/beta fold hydrolase [Candidatus Angelobacter sp.]
MKKFVFLLVLLAGTLAYAQNIVGDWQGTLKVGPTELRLVLHITKDNSGFKATLDSIDQGANGIPVSSVSLKDSRLDLTIEAVHGTYQGKVNREGTVITGTWTQTQPLPLEFKRAKAPIKGTKSTAELQGRRPQDPVKPYPYREEELTYENKVQGVTLGATLTIPPGKGPFPAVVLITGSGPQDRDEALLGHRPFLVLSDYLTRKGIEVLRADDRGVGKSTGSFGKATTADFATDVEAGVAYLKTRPEVDQHKIGLIGHSEGGVIAPMVAARNPDVAFIVMMAGSGVPGDAIITEQLRLIEEANGKSHEQAVKDAAEEAEVLALVKREKDEAALENELREKLAGRIPEAQLGGAIQQVTSPWFRYFIVYDPSATLAKVKCPVLAINGEKDLQVPPRQNLPAIRNALEKSGNKDFEVDELPGLNHLFQTAKTGSPSEYGSIEETIAPVALEKMASWILKH